MFGNNNNKLIEYTEEEATILVKDLLYNNMLITNTHNVSRILKNNTLEKLVISDIKSLCDCISVSVDKNIIDVNEEYTITASINMLKASSSFLGSIIADSY